MSYSIIFSFSFNNEIKHLIKKYPSLKEDIIKLIITLKKNPAQGIPLGNNIYKVRLSVTSKGKGKSGGIRIMTLVQTGENRLILFFIYNKGNRDSLSKKEIKELIKDL
ncbi:MULTISPECIES: type II toxin-antitoxin system RelE/ParE family toxin [Candidatus Cardinium]|uniref:type II toxin-antitoxin system RelE/ParE family toxin n=1 Tax=Candidatus Cardinium TaxID=273135 RepID=UPI001FAA8BAB|nr:MULTISPECIES: type II toxin-antitoxin system RelE/ParE family toxin [Cardinium]